MPPSREACDCAVSVLCVTDGSGEVTQLCLRCGAASVVERRPAIVLSKRRAAEFAVFARHHERIEREAIQEEAAS